MPIISKKTFNALVDILIPHCDNPSSRRALATQALYGCSVLKQVDYSGNTRDYVVQFVETLLKYGECAENQLAIVAILEHIKAQVGIDREQEIDRLVSSVLSDIESPNLPLDTPLKIQKIIKSLSDDWDPNVRIRALQELGKEKYLTTVPYIGKSLVEDEDWKVRIEAAKTLEIIGSKDAIPYMVEAMNDESSSVRNAVIKRLGRFGTTDEVEKIAPYLTDEASIVQKAAVQALAEIRTPNAIKYLILYHIECGRSKINQGILEVLIGLGDATVPILLSLLTDDDVANRVSSASLLFNLGNSTAEQSLIDCVLRDSDIEVRQNALIALAKLNINMATPLLLDVLNDKDPIMRMCGAGLLGETTKSPKIIEALQEALNDDDERVCHHAKRSLDKLEV